MKTGRIVSLWLPVAAMMGLLYFASSRTDPPGVPSGWDKLVHLAVYALLGLLALRAIHDGWRRLTPAGALAALLLGGAYGAFDEFHQSQVAGRHASVGDWLADLAGLLLAVIFVATMLAVRRAAGSEGKGAV